MTRQGAATLAVLAFTALLAACSMQDLAARMTPKGDLPLAHRLFDLSRQRDIAAETALFADDAAPDPQALRALNRLLAAGARPSLTGVQVSSLSGRSTHTRLTYRIARGQQSYVVMLQIGGPAGHRVLRALTLGESVDLFAQWPRLKPIIECVSLAALGLLALVLGLVTWLARRRRVRRNG